jgi:hypothetical protein
MSPLLQEVLKQAEHLSVGDRLELIQRVAEGLKQTQQEKEPKPKRSWRELRGLAPNVLGGQDAQEWVNELRSEWDKRESRLREGL